VILQCSLAFFLNLFTHCFPTHLSLLQSHSTRLGRIMSPPRRRVFRSLGVGVSVVSSPSCFAPEVAIFRPLFLCWGGGNLALGARVGLFSAQTPDSMKTFGFPAHLFFSKPYAKTKLSPLLLLRMNTIFSPPNVGRNPHSKDTPPPPPTCLKNYRKLSISSVMITASPRSERADEFLSSRS